jgi:elongation factor 2
VKKIDSINTKISSFQSTDVDEPWIIDPVKGSLAFGSGKFSWCVSLTYFARLYSKKFKINEETMREKLWGENYFNLKTRTWKTDS